MSDLIIQDGTGTRNKAQVDSQNRLHVLAVGESQLAYISEKEGSAYIIANRGFETITTINTETPICYIKNTSLTNNLHIYSIRTCGTQVQKWQMYAQVGATSSIITNALAGSVETLNLTKVNNNVKSIGNIIIELLTFMLIY